MRLSTIADAFESQYNDSKTYEGLSFEDRFGILMDKNGTSDKVPYSKRLCVMSNSVIPMPV